MELKFEKNFNYQILGEPVISSENTIVYKAREMELVRDVCIKGVKLKGKNDFERSKNLKLALREVKTIVKVRNEHIINIADVYNVFHDKRNQILYIIMQWIDGKTLRETDSCEKEFLQWMIKLCEILECMERKEIYHRDIKPENIIINKFRNLYLIDFNLSLRAPNKKEGTINYRAPEMNQVFKYPSREKVDIFSIGVILYEFYTKELPIDKKHYYKKGSKSTKWEFFIEPKISNPKISNKLNETIIKCMKLNPKDRFDSINELKRCLNSLI
ncbi:MAG: serine/threonine-protein kinase [Clostridiales bacterium]